MIDNEIGATEIWMLVSLPMLRHEQGEGIEVPIRQGPSYGKGELTGLP